MIARDMPEEERFWAKANTHVTRGGHRVCRKCSYIRLKSYREKKRAS